MFVPADFAHEPDRELLHRILHTFDTVLGRLDVMALDLAALKTAAADLTAEVAAVTAVLAADTDQVAVDAVVAEVTAAKDALAAALAPPVPVVAPSLPLYEHVGAVPFDSAVWLVAPVKASDGTVLYTFTGDQPGGPAMGPSDQWTVYVGVTVPA